MISNDVDDFYRRWSDLSTAVGAAVSGDEGPTLSEVRDRYRAFFRSTVVVPDGLRVDPVDVAGVPAEWLTPVDASAGRVLLYLHGGAYIVGHPDGYRGLAGALATRLHARALVPDYRLSPEAPFPAAIDDCLGVYRWLLEQGIEPADVVVAGDSAGGAMAVSVLVAARDEGLPMPAASIAISPWANLEHTGATMFSRDGIDPSVTREGLRGSAEVFLGHAPTSHPLASPVFADTHGLPPVLIQVGGNEVMLSDAIRLAATLAQDGVSTRLEVAPGMGHVWHLLAGRLPAADDAVAAAAAFAAGHLRRTP